MTFLGMSGHPPSVGATLSLQAPSQIAGDLLKQAPLLVPVDPADNGPQVSLVEGLEGPQKQDLFLDVRRKMKQLHDLGDAGARYPAAAGQLGIVGNGLLSQQSFKLSNRMASAISRAIRGIDDPVPSSPGGRGVRFSRGPFFAARKSSV